MRAHVGLGDWIDCRIGYVYKLARRPDIPDIVLTGLCSRSVLVTGIPSNTTTHVVTTPRFTCVIYCRRWFLESGRGFLVWSSDMAEVVAVYGSRRRRFRRLGDCWPGREGAGWPRQSWGITRLPHPPSLGF